MKEYWRNPLWTALLVKLARSNLGNAYICSEIIGLMFLLLLEMRRRNKETHHQREQQSIIRVVIPLKSFSLCKLVHVLEKYIWLVFIVFFAYFCCCFYSSVFVVFFAMD